LIIELENRNLEFLTERKSDFFPTFSNSKTGRIKIMFIELENRNLEFLTEQKSDFFPTFLQMLLTMHKSTKKLGIKHPGLFGS
jgi:hypothetical protein